MDTTTVTHFTTVGSQESLSDGSQDFGVTDRFGRPVGIVWGITRITYVREAIPSGCRYPEQYASDYYQRPIGVKYRAYSQVSRNGKAYGAAQGCPEFATIEEAQAEVARRIATARKANVRKFTPKAS